MRQRQMIIFSWHPILIGKLIAFKSCLFIVVLLLSAFSLKKKSEETRLIINGEHANIEDTPWVVAIMTSNNQYRGVGIAIGPRWVLTAAHTMARLGQGGQIIAGLTDLNDLTLVTENNEFRHQIVRRIIHNEYDAGDSDDDDAGNDGDAGVDLALVEVDRDLPATIRFIGRETFETFEQPLLRTGLQTYYLGWGRNGNDLARQFTLRRGHNPIHDINDQTLEFAFNENDPRPAEGDSGGPAYVYERNFEQNILIGMIVEADEYTADLVRLDIHAQWINDITGIAPLDDDELDDDYSTDTEDDQTEDDQTDDEVNEPEENLLNQAIVATGVGATAIMNAIMIGNGAAPNLQNEQVEIQPPANEEEVEPLINNPEPAVQNDDGLRRRARRTQNIEVLDNCGK